MVAKGNVAHDLSDGNTIARTTTIGQLHATTELLANGEVSGLELV